MKRFRRKRANPQYVRRYREIARAPYLRGHWDSIIEWQDEIAKADCIHWRGPRCIRIQRPNAYATAGRTET